MTQFPALEPLERPCPNCGSAALRVFYSQQGIPVNSCILMQSEAEARGYPRGDLRLAWCEACGFLTNAAFDPGKAEYSERYEETQAFSGTFNAFARSLAQRLVDRYDLRRKTVLEIGCGKGEFLVLLCELGENTGTGIDPGYHPERTDSLAAERLTFIRDFYDERYHHLTADFVCCRHTLEHIPDTQRFLQQLRQNLGDREETLVFFEVPDVLRVLEEGAFWDIYYEHCTYFTPGSLARLFRQTGFELLELELDYDDQYILIVAKPAPGPTQPSLPLEDDLARIRRGVESFQRTCSEGIARWQGVFDELGTQGEEAVIWGAGSKGVSFLTTLQSPAAVRRAVDINPFKHDKFMPHTAHPVIAPERLSAAPPHTVVVMNPIYEREIGAQLQGLGLSPRLLCV